MSERTPERIDTTARRGVREHGAITRDDIATITCEHGDARIVNVGRKAWPRNELHVPLSDDQERKGDDKESGEASDRAVDVHLTRGRRALAQERESFVRAHRQIRAVLVRADRRIDENPHAIFGQP